MNTTELTTKGKRQLSQDIWSLRNKMVDQLATLEKIHNISFPKDSDGVEALYTVYQLVNSKEYTQLESTLRKRAQERQL